MDTLEFVDRGAMLTVIGDAAVFAELEPADREELAILACCRTYLPGEWLFHEATPRHWFGIVAQGAVELVRGPEDRAMRVAALGPGSCLAEGLLLDGLPHSVSAITGAGATVVQFPATQLVRLRADHPALFSRLARCVVLAASERLRARAEELARAADAPAEPTAG